MHSRTRGYLPHFIKDQGIYFVTIRLADSVPMSPCGDGKMNYTGKLRIPIRNRQKSSIGNTNVKSKTVLITPSAAVR